MMRRSPNRYFFSSTRLILSLNNSKLSSVPDEEELKGEGYREEGGEEVAEMLLNDAVESVIGLAVGKR